MRFGYRLIVSLALLGLSVPLAGQDSLSVKGSLGDTLVLHNATVTAKSREQ